MKMKLLIEGMHCVSCKTLIEEVSREVAGVESANVDVESGIGEFEHDEMLDTGILIKEIEGLGDYKVSVV